MRSRARAGGHRVADSLLLNRVTEIRMPVIEGKELLVSNSDVIVILGDIFGLSFQPVCCS